MINTTIHTQINIRKESGWYVMIFIFVFICMICFVKYLPIRLVTNRT